MHDNGTPFEFTSLTSNLEGPGVISSDRSYNFAFNRVEKQYESYNGNNVRLRYFLRVSCARQYASNVTKVMDLAVQNLAVEPEVNSSIKMEVGIEDWSDGRKARQAGHAPASSGRYMSLVLLLTSLPLLPVVSSAAFTSSSSTTSRSTTSKTW